MPNSIPRLAMRCPVSEIFSAAAPSLVGGESLCIWQRGQEQLMLCAGEERPGVPWAAHTLTPIFSATKPFSAACLLLALHERGGTPELPVGELWASFPAPHCSIAQLLSHQVGLASWVRSARYDDTDACRAAVESTTPAWLPPAHGYHPHTFGPLVDILMLRLTGQRIAEFWEMRVRRPLGLDLYIGLPESERHRVAPLRPPRVRGCMPHTDFYRSYVTPATPTFRAFHCLSGLPSLREMNTPEAWQCACPARGGIASARGLAMAYQALLGELPGSPFGADVRSWLATPRCSGGDLTLLTPTSFSCGAMCAPKPFFGRGGFGHPGAGGFHAFAEPSIGCSFAYSMSQMQLGILPSERVSQLISAFMRQF